VASCAARRVAQVSWSSAGRSTATRSRAHTAGLYEFKNLSSLVAEVDLVVSCCPPHAALATAKQVAACNFSGLYVDANAVAPITAASIAKVVKSAGANYVDGGVIGPPAVESGTTRLYLSGARAPDVADVFKGSALEAVSIGTDECAASTLKMAYAAWTKGSLAMLIAVAALAKRGGVASELRDEWARSQPQLHARLERDAGTQAHKAWRFAGEMDEIAQTFSDLGLPNDFHHGASTIYSALDSFWSRTDEIPLEELIAALLAELAEQ